MHDYVWSHAVCAASSACSKRARMANGAESYSTHHIPFPWLKTSSVEFDHLAPLLDTVGGFLVQLPRVQVLKSVHPAMTGSRLALAGHGNFRAATELLSGYHFYPIAMMKYTDLLPGEIRLLTIYPSRYPKATVRCTLYHTPLDTAIYDALSYVWGHANPAGTILIDGEEVTVTPNLLAALRRLRDTQNERVLWVDALCINQEDDQEKSAQVQAMGKIFRKASMVACWLGEADSTSSRAMGVVREMATAFGDLSPTAEEPEDWAMWLKRMWDFCQRNSESFGAFKNLLHRQFWLRIWTAQEVFLARRVVIYCGNESAEWTRFHDLHMILSFYSSVRAPSRDTDLMPLFQDIMALLDTMQTCKAIHSVSLLDTLVQYRFRDSTDPRDKIFGLLSLCNHGGFTADYGKGTKQIYEEVARHLIEKDRNLDVLCAINPPELTQTFLQRWSRRILTFIQESGVLRAMSPASALSIHEYSLASWAADWRVHIPPNYYLLLGHLSSYNASCGSHPQAEFSREAGSHKLELKGVEIGRIQSCFRKRHNLEELEHAIKLMLAFWLNNKPKDGAYGGIDDELRAFLRTMTVRQAMRALCKFLDNGDRWRRRPRKRYSEAMAQLGAVASEECHRHVEERRPSLPGRELQRLEVAMAVSLFCITDSGLMGRVPLTAREGDIVAVFAGGKVPFVLRRGRLDVTYSIIGDCYIDGIMDGESFEPFLRGERELVPFSIA